MKKFFNNSWTVGIGTGLIVVLVAYFLFGIGKNDNTVQYFPANRLSYTLSEDRFSVISEARYPIWIESGYVDGQVLQLGQNSGLLKPVMENTLWLTSRAAKEIFVIPTSTVRIQFRTSAQDTYCFEYVFSYIEVVRESLSSGYKSIEPSKYSKGGCKIMK